ncbi:hypothetical protein [Sulfurimonas paralvinellae]|uniref:Uncharacterized protein n=1 Tax=Sulfurimonas paralvinellae TaxID=317658 RepID=A0A7M1B5I8_9BACT|nr:hypothetical protein [Sulfurimonas paralvinellae]QOP44776.1 hypothetical protein FM071_00045 [Sulfurimonas paralvinellae]
MYLLSLLIIVVLVYFFFQHNNTLLLLITLAIGGYIVYSHETGHTATEFKNDMVNSINDEAQGFEGRKGIKRFDPQKMKEEVEGNQ